ncbi:MAG: hypothetical protein AAF591_22265 [Verrucomicrobiota bacterium]
MNANFFGNWILAPEHATNPDPGLLMPFEFSLKLLATVPATVPAPQTPSNWFYVKIDFQYGNNTIDESAWMARHGNTLSYSWRPRNRCRLNLNFTEDNDDMEVRLSVGAFGDIWHLSSSYRYRRIFKAPISFPNGFPEFVTSTDRFANGNNNSVETPLTNSRNGVVSSV